MTQQSFKAIPTSILLKLKPFVIKMATGNERRVTTRYAM